MCGIVEAVSKMAPDEPLFSVVNAKNRVSIHLHERLGFSVVERGPSFARIEFVGGEGVLLRRSPATSVESTQS